MSRAGCTGCAAGCALGSPPTALIALKAGYPSGVLGRPRQYKMPPNYHSQRDIAANVDFENGRGVRGDLPGGASARSAAPASSRARASASSRVAISPA